VANSPTLARAIIGNPILFFGLMIAELGLVFALSGWVMRMSVGTAAAVFLGYAVLNGLTLSVVFLAYAAASIALAFYITAGTFVVMSLWGYATKSDLTAIGNICFMGLIGIIIAMVVNLFVQSAALHFVVSVLGVLVFVGLTAYDTQEIKSIYLESDDSEVSGKKAILGALKLYLDFINIFVMLLQLIGDRR
jgi:FtsH-binding integral membrane protein